MSQVLRGECKARDISYCVSLPAAWSRPLYRASVVHKQVTVYTTLNEESLAYDHNRRQKDKRIASGGSVSAGAAYRNP